jgi:N-acyl-D-aspartate/D-glutamate deacylase
MLESLRDPAVQKRVSQDFLHGLPGWENQVGAVGWERIFLASLQHVEYRVLEGLSLAEVADRLNLTPEAAFFQFLLEEKGQITVIIFSMDEHDVDQAIQAPFAMIGSDGLPLRSGRPHPRLYGTFPRYIQRYVRELKSFSLEEAVRKITSFPAQRFGLAERGQLRPRAFADLVLFDPNEIGDRATYDKPQVYPDGVQAVIVSGQPVVWRGQLQSHLPGHLLAPAGQLVPEKHQINSDF